MNNQEWATLVLQDGGWPVSANNLTFMLQWMASEEPPANWANRNNPLNNGLGSGGGSGLGSYPDLATAAKFVAQNLNAGDYGYPAVASALASSAPPNVTAQAIQASSWAASHYGNGSAWHSGSVPIVDSSGAATGQTSAGTATTGAQAGVSSDAQATSAGTTAGTGVDPNDATAVQQYVDANYGADAWMLSNPELYPIIQQSVQNGWTQAEFTAAIEKTTFWKTTSQAQIAYDALKNENPAEVSFTIAGSQASQKYAAVMAMAGTNGVELSTAMAQQLATESMQYGWTDQQLQQAVGAEIRYDPKTATNTGTGIIQQLQNSAGQYLTTVDSTTLQTWAQKIAEGTATSNDYTAYLAQQASIKYPTMAAQIKQGYTPEQLVDPLRSEAAKTMEVSADSINFENDPMYKKILSYVPPDQNGQTQPARMMTDSEMDTYLRGTTPYGYTQGARDSAASMESQLLQTWGKIAST